MSLYKISSVAQKYTDASQKTYTIFEAFPAGNYMFKVNNKNTRRRRFGIFITYFFEHISHLCSSASIVNFEQVNAGWVEKKKINLNVETS